MRAPSSPEVSDTCFRSGSLETDTEAEICMQEVYCEIYLE